MRPIPISRSVLSTVVTSFVCALVVGGSPSAILAQERGAVGTVTLSRTDYDRLLDLTSRPPRLPDVPPLPAALTRADIRVRVAGGTVRATMTLDGEVFQAGAVKVPLITHAVLLDARATDGDLPLVAEGSSHMAVVSGPATFSATLEWGSPLVTTAGRGSFVLPVPAAGSVMATFDVPGEQSDLGVSPGLVTRRTSADGRTTIEATLDPGSQTRVSWSSRESSPTTPPRDVRMLADVKTLVTIGDADLRLLTIVDLTVVQGEPAEIDVRLPPGYELAGATGSSLERSDDRGDRVVLVVSAPARRRHQFLLNLERATSGGSLQIKTGFPTLPAAQRETGEVAIEGVGTLEVTTKDVPGLRRMDVREVDSVLLSAVRQPLLAAFRYQRGVSGTPALALDVARFPDAPVLSAIAERAVATTLVTSEGRGLTEVSLRLLNRAQPFMKVALPAGASMLSIEVAGAPAKPVEGADGLRVPLLRPGFRPEGVYVVTFVYLHAGTPFAKKGDMQMTLPRMDVPVSVVEWELFVPDRYRADRFAGSAIAADLVERAISAGRARQQEFDLAGGRLEETVTVTEETPGTDRSAATRSGAVAANEPRGQTGGVYRPAQSEPSANVQSLQRRATGVLPIRMDVPRAGTSHRFLRPLVIDEETVVRFRYRRR